MIRRDFITSSSYNKAVATKERRSGESTSTNQDSYKHHQAGAIRDAFKREKDAYETNKSKHVASGEWWGNKDSVEPEKSNYARDYKQEGPPTPQSSTWDQHHRKKVVEQPTDHASEKHYNILTGNETWMPSGGRYDPSRSAKRISADKLNSQQQALEGRHYNIITNLNLEDS
ncbi:hypothetical protein HK097_003975 [Rhizophlyctis rosea]|uniref:Uncharacterized protein n=1 Tax=Rhizophlyctis rosea TaxID=64517 RepID=A0AAD5SEE2_9FUNG|nr:hypothetical protein HK097_003975 [Rhizophlyctis rosea]